MLYNTACGFGIAYPIACALPKMSICYLYFSLFKVHQQTRRITQIMMVFLLVNAIAWLLPTIVIATEHASKRSHDLHILFTWICLPNTVSDLILLCIPLPVLRHMQMKRAKKVGVAITFLAGALYESLPFGS